MTQHTRDQHRQYMRQWRAKNPQRERDLQRKANGSLTRIEYQRQYYQANKERLKEQKQAYYQANKLYFKQKALENYNRQKDGKMIARAAKRRTVLEHYGNKCNCCGETTEQFLAIDHVNNDGYLQRQKIRISIIEYALRNNYPTDLQILCHNCNNAKAFYGKCPHSNC